LHEIELKIDTYVKELQYIYRGKYETNEEAGEKNNAWIT
jgi:hypothetical protein